MLLVFILLTFLTVTSTSGPSTGMSQNTGAPGTSTSTSTSAPGTSTSSPCIDAAATQGTKSFIQFIFGKYTGSNTSTVIEEKELDKLMKDLYIGTNMRRSRIQRRKFKSDVERKIFLAIAREAISKQIEKTKCYTSQNLLKLHNVSATNGISKHDFLRMCPSFIHAIESRACERKERHDKDPPSKSEVWGYGFLSITVISFASLALIVIIPFIPKSIYARVMSYLVALAVGTLSGDALLHLIPHAFGEGTNQAIHIHVTEEEELKQEMSQVWRALFVLLGIYAFFGVELVMKLRGGGHSHSHGGNEDNGHAHNGKSGSIRKERAPSQKSVSYKNEAIEIEFPGNGGGDTKEITYESGNEVIIYKSQRKPSLRDPGQKEITGETPVRTVAWVVIIGDGFHNFTDGLAIGAAFSASMSSGISTSIAVFCHELPHELGDFAVLLSSGMKMKQAIVYNLVSTILAYAGLTVGILAGGEETGRHFILSITAGLFLYVSLADLLPELTNEDIPGQSKVCTFITQNAGICTGIVIMVIISLYEHKMGG